MTVMNDKNSGKRAARARLAEQRAKEAAKAKRKRGLIIGGAVIAVLAVAAVIGVVVQNDRAGSGAYASPRGTVGAGGLMVPVGSPAAKAVLMVYEDPRCPACGGFEKGFHTTLNQLEKAGKVRIEYHVVSFIDRHDNGSGSKHAAAALGCAQNAGKFHDYHDVLYANQPLETTDPWADRAALITLAKKVPGLDTPAFESCVNNGTYAGWVSAVEQDFDKSGYNSTPTVLLNGTSAYPTYNGQSITPASLTAAIDKIDS